MDDFHNTYGGGFNFGPEPIPEPFPEPDLGIDPMAFMPGVFLDGSRENYAASLAIQQSLEAVQQSIEAGQQLDYMPSGVYNQLTHTQQQAWLEQEYQRNVAEGIPAKYYSPVDHYAHRTDLTEAQKRAARDDDARTAWGEDPDRNRASSGQPADHGRGQKVFHKKSVEAPTGSNSPLTPHGPSSEAPVVYPKNLRGILRFTWDCLKDALR